MATVFDAAKHVLETHGPITHMKLQKLLYYAQAWSLVWDETPLFEETIQAWANGPVVPDLFAKLQGKFKVSAAELPIGDAAVLTDKQREAITRVYDFYGPRDAQWLSDLTHMELPWQQARIGLANGERGDHEITHASMYDYYSAL